MSCCNNFLSGFDFDEMCRQEKEKIQFEKDFAHGFGNDFVRKIIKKMLKQYHIESIARAGGLTSFDEFGNYIEPFERDLETGRIYRNSGFMYRIQYWHHDPYLGKINHVYCFNED